MRDRLGLRSSGDAVAHRVRSYKAAAKQLGFQRQFVAGDPGTATITLDLLLL